MMPGQPKVPPEMMAQMLAQGGPPPGAGGPPPGGPPMGAGGPPPGPGGPGGPPPMSPDALQTPDQAIQLLQQLGIQESALPMVAKAVTLLGGGVGGPPPGGPPPGGPPPM